MKGILSYDSKIMRLLDTLANTMILNALFLVFSIPIVTIGASYTALYSGCRAMLKREPCFKAFFRAFRSSFKRATLAWLILLPMTALSTLSTFSIMYYQMDGYEFPLVMAAIGLIFLCALNNVVFLFYSRFECTLGQLLKNAVLITLAHSLRCLVIAVFAWVPMVLFFLAPEIFLQMTVVWIFMYFATMATVSVWLMSKPFKKLAISVLGEEEVEKLLEEERREREAAREQARR